jgi:cell division protein ZapA (FtsZ GTPase activity inhibitor)
MSSAANSSKRTYKVRIFQQTYSIVSSANEAEFQLIADHVDQLMHTIASRSGSTDGTRAAVMAAMHLADRLHQAEKRLESVHADQRQALRQVGEQTDQLERLLKETLELDGFDIEAIEPKFGIRQAAPRAVSPLADAAPRTRNRAENTPSTPSLFAMEDTSAEDASAED